MPPTQPGPPEPQTAPQTGKLGATHPGNAAPFVFPDTTREASSPVSTVERPASSDILVFFSTALPEKCHPTKHGAVPPTFIEQGATHGATHFLLSNATKRCRHKEVPPIQIQNLGATHRYASSVFGNKTKALCKTVRDASRRKPNVVSAPNYRHRSLLFSAIDHFHCGLVIKSLRRTYLISPPLLCKSQQFRADSMSNHRLLR